MSETKTERSKNNLLMDSLAFTKMYELDSLDYSFKEKGLSVKVYIEDIKSIQDNSDLQGDD